MRAGKCGNPRFTFHGFQYMEVTGYPGELTEDDITAVAISSLQEQTGNFESSNDLVNQLQKQYQLGPAGQLYQCAHRLPPAR